MSWDLWFSNAVSYWVQILALVVSGGVLLMVGGIAPRLRLLWAQTLLVVCLLLPLISPWNRPRRVDLGAIRPAAGGSPGWWWATLPSRWNSPGSRHCSPWPQPALWRDWVGWRWAAIDCRDTRTLPNRGPMRMNSIP